MTAKHRRTDPACYYHREPRTWLGRIRYDRARGMSCAPCMVVRALPGERYWPGPNPSDPHPKENDQ